MLEFVFWDVQHGHATYIRTPNNRHMVVDLGIGSFSTKHEFSPLRHLRNNYGVQQLDYVIITHPHRDHIDDIFEFDNMNPKTLHRPRHLSADVIRAGNKSGDFNKIDKYLEIEGRYNLPVLGTPGDIDVPANWGNVRMSFFVSNGCNTNNLNNHSVVSIFEYLGVKIVIPGDNEKISWNELLKDIKFCTASQNADVLLAPHHGRESGFCPELMDHVRPRFVVISDGPAGETSCTEKYAAKIRQYRTTGWRGYYRDNTWDERFCVTTRCDGMIRVRVFKSSDNVNRLNLILHDGTGQNRN